MIIHCPFLVPENATPAELASGCFHPAFIALYREAGIAFEEWPFVPPEPIEHAKSNPRKGEFKINDTMTLDWDTVFSDNYQKDLVTVHLRVAQ